jgi:hypothetical protein
MNEEEDEDSWDNEGNDQKYIKYLGHSFVS